MSAPPKMPPNNHYAFPLAVSIPDGMGGTYYSSCPGMTLREYFAAAAIPEAMRLVAQSGMALLLGEAPEDTVARVAWDIAAAMMKRRTP
mgnify:CR=1 FL=1